MKRTSTLLYESMLSQPRCEELVYHVLRDKGRRPCRPLHLRLRELEDSISGGSNIPEGSLRLAALHFQKDVRTIRRWCARGVFPTAKRTAGGHWRIPFEDICKAHPPADSRSPKTSLGLRGRKRFLRAPVQLLIVFLVMLKPYESLRAF